MPTATSYTNKIRYLAIAKNVKVQLPGGVSNTFRPALSNMCSDFKITTPAVTTTTGGIITTIAGTGTSSVTGNGGLAVNATLKNPTCAIDDWKGNIFYADTTGNTSIIRRIDRYGVITNTGITTTTSPITSFTIDKRDRTIYFCNKQNIFVINSIENDYYGVEIYTAVDFSLSHIAFDGSEHPDNSILFSTSTDTKIYRIPFIDGTPTTPTELFSASSFTSPSRPITVDPSGNIYVTSLSYNISSKIYTWSVKKYNISSSLVWTVNLGTTIGISGYRTILLTGITIGPDGNVYVSSAITRINRVVRIDNANQSQTTFAGGGPRPLFSGDGELATQSNLNYPTSIEFDAQSNLLICDRLNYRIRKVTPLATTTTLEKTTYNPPWFVPVKYVELCDCKIIPPLDIIVYDGQ